jgi:Toastrack DUF4097
MQLLAPRSLFVACITAGFALAGCKHSVATRRTEQFIPVAKGTQVHVSVTTGYISVAAGRKGMVSLKVFRKVRAVWSSDSKLKLIEVDATKKNGLLSIVGKSPSSEGGKKFHMHLRITVPPSTNLVLKTGHGHINLTNLRGDIVATAKRGEMRARGVTGRVTLTTNEGNISLRGAPLRFGLRTRLGDVNLWLRPETQLVEKSEARTESGALTLTASTKLHALITAEAKGDKIQSAFPLTAKKPHWAQARLGRGAPPISLFCHKGSLHLKKW